MSNYLEQLNRHAPETTRMARTSREAFGVQVRPEDFPESAQLDLTRGEKAILIICWLLLIGWRLLA